MRGRSDKRFCSSDCRSAYHNRHRREEMLTLRKLEANLLRNFRLLRKVRKEGLSQMSRGAFERMGFDFSFYTHSMQGVRNEQIFFCYDMPYMLEEDTVVFLTAMSLTARLLPIESFMR